GTPTAAEEPWPGAIAWRCSSLALWSYRQEDYAAALRWCQRCLSYRNDAPALAATANAILALSYCQLGQLQNATNALALSRNLADHNGNQGPWFDWALDRVLMKEGATLIQQQVPSSSNSVYFKEGEALARRQAEARQVIAKTVSLINKNQMAEADQLLGTLPVTGRTGPLGLTVFRALGDWAAIQGNWHRAAEYYSALVPLNGFEAPFLATQDHIKYAVALAEVADRPAYEKLCRESIKQVGDTANPHLVERIVKPCSLLPPTASVFAELSPLAAKVLESIPADTKQNSWALPWECMSLALFEYRRGNYPESVNWGDRCLSCKQDSAMERIAGTQAILAMSYHQLGQAEQARSALRRSRELVEERWKVPFTADDEYSRSAWYDWVLARILEGEAAATIEAPVHK
ncbi:MAG: tetratricopeptide repeat protein, partial [Limisphaerales bacterium]